MVTRRTRTRAVPVEEEVKTTATTIRRRQRPTPQAEEVEEEAAPVVAMSQEEPAVYATENPRVDYERIVAEYKAKATTPKNAIRAHCVDCMGGMTAEIRRCTSHDCALYPFRMGENPFHARSKHRVAENGQEDE